MKKKFIEGLIFGSGFGIAFTIIYFLSSYWASPMLAKQTVKKLNEDLKKTTTFPAQQSIEVQTPYHELSTDEQIKRSSVITLAKYETNSDGTIKAIITDFLKKDDGVEFYYSIGDEFPQAVYPDMKISKRNQNILIFFEGSPASMRQSTGIFDGRIAAFGDMPLDLLKNKIKDK